MPEEHDSANDSRLAESEQRYRAVIENASDMIQSVRPDGTFEFVNRAWLRKLGYHQDDIPGLTVWNIIHPDSAEHCRPFFLQAVHGEAVDYVDAT